ncbi:MAG: alpha/beta fold hydrolase [Deltaproteobacteria bacterium]|nr:alpha/beta fold hydrolase [Deltaproteobacteria bacterium]
MTTHPLKLKHPVVLVHGLGGRSSYGPFDYFHGLPALLREAGNEVLIPNLTPFHTMETRARQLKEQIQAALPEGQVNLVSHSFGGLDARYLAANFGFTERVASVTTIGAPNRGTVVADIILGLVPDSTFHAMDFLLAPIGNSARPYQQITSKFCAEQMPTVAPMMPSVGYFSATSVIRTPVVTNALPLFWVPHRIITRYEGENDGFVSEHSAKFGTHICTHYGDHYAQIGQFLGRSRGLDYLKFYSEIFERLKREGF